MHQQLWGYKVEEKLYVGVREQKRLNTTGLRLHQYTAYVSHVLEHVPNCSYNNKRNRVNPVICHEGTDTT
jgi:hypothetical protein